MKKRILPYLFCSILALGTAPCVYAITPKEALVAATILIGLTQPTQSESCNLLETDYDRQSRIADECRDIKWEKYQVCLDDIFEKYPVPRGRCHYEYPPGTPQYPGIQNCKSQYHCDVAQCPSHPSLWEWLFS